MSSRILTATLLALLAGCGGFERGEPLLANGDEDVGGDGEGGSFATSAYPVLERLCAGCHGPGGVASGTRFSLSQDVAASHASVSALVDTSTPANSRLLIKGTGNAHGGGAVLTVGSPDYQTILDWIAGGAAP